MITFNDKIDQGAISRVQILERNNIPLVLNQNRHSDFRKVAFSSIFPNFHKDFFFRLLNNTLLLNYQISKFEQNIDPRCSYCVAKTTPNVSEKENAFHLFIQCDNLTLLRQVITNDNLFHTPINGTDLMLGGMGHRPSEIFLKNIIILNFNRLVYNYRRNARALTPEKLTSDLSSILRLLSQASRKLNTLVTAHAENYPLFKDKFNVNDY